MTVVDRPARGTRPANRRELILAAATHLFASRGYEHVSIGDVAEAVAVGPSALYRHFAGKEQLLAQVISDIADRFAAELEAPADPAQLLPAAATFALDNRTAGVLWEREARHLPTETQAAVRARIRHARHRFTLAVRAARPALSAHDADLVAAAVFAVLLSPSFHRLDLPRPGYDALLTQLAHQVLVAEVPPAPEAAAPATPQGLPRAAKREQLLDAAIRLFARRTYARVSMEDVAASVGMAASSVYNHFPSKLHMLVTALDRANGYLQLTMAETLAVATDPATALPGLLASYARFAVAHPHLVDMLIAEVRNLPRDQAAALLQAQREYVDEWVHLLRHIHAGLDNTAARVLVLAALMVINDLARTPAIRARPAADLTLAALGRHVLTV